MDYKKIGFFISTLRKEANLTQLELSRMLLVTDRAVSKWERGLGCPDISLLIDLSRIFNVSILEILRGERLENKMSNDDFIFSLSFLKNKFFSTLNTLLVSIFCFTFVYIIFMNIMAFYKVNKTYTTNFDNEFSDDYFALKNKIEFVESSNLNFEEEEKKVILNFVNKIDEYLNENKKIFLTSSTNYKELKKMNITLDITRYKIYSILLKYDYSLFENYVTTSANFYYLHSNMFDSFNSTFHPYYYTDINIDINSIHYFISSKMKIDITMLDDIMKVGIINE